MTCRVGRRRSRHWLDRSAADPGAVCPALDRALGEGRGVDRRREGQPAASTACYTVRNGPTATQSFIEGAAMASQHSVLVVDDDSDNRESLAELLAVHGYAASTAADGDEAVRMAVEQPPELIILDLVMP